MSSFYVIISNDPLAGIYVTGSYSTALEAQTAIADLIEETCLFEGNEDLKDEMPNRAQCDDWLFISAYDEFLCDALAHDRLPEFICQSVPADKTQRVLTAVDPLRIPYDTHQTWLTKLIQQKTGIKIPLDIDLLKHEGFFTGQGVTLSVRENPKSRLIEVIQHEQDIEADSGTTTE